MNKVLRPLWTPSPSANQVIPSYFKCCILAIPLSSKPSDFKLPHKTYLDYIAKTSSTSTNSSDEESKNKKKGKEDEVSIKEYKPLIEFVEED